MSSTGSNLKGIAFIGAGLYAKETLASTRAVALPLKAVWSRTQKSAAELSAEAASQLGLAPDVYYDVPDASDGDEKATARSLAALLAREDIVAVNIILPICAQPAVIREALAAGKHVLSAKPIAPDVREGKALVAEYEGRYKRRGLVWRIAENFESEPGYVAAGRAVREGKIGKVNFFSMRSVGYMDKTSKWYKTPWRTVPDYQGGFLLDGGVHQTSALRIMLSPVTHLTGFASLYKSYLPPHDTTHSVLKTASGAQGILEMTFAAPSSTLTKGNGTTISGSNGWLSVESARGTDASGKEIGVIRVTTRSVEVSEDGKAGPETVETADYPVRGVEAEWESFFAVVKGEKDDGLGSPRGALADVAIVEAALTSQGELVDLVKLIS
ncbi:NAD(P)-binding protein [Coniophora puteana RWD-64-598 SS2]|uniref:NAD(P)-binding protein n=1 Tax=Coniophora puteana (strain RWD-64-598) TaxID=741705 RepID=A0A5M3MLJ9_CONPW|nr:NAD(P)-binding protein [Coniophora puteana RWD-64-598 SS2]EIW79451.1 NAD(P)-binding protein [Coniophora puteana RWD-64-598 SS2]